MKHLTYFFIFVITLIAFTSCDGKDRAYKTNKEVLQEHKLLDTFSKNIKYIPEAYQEVKVDTLLTNGFKVNITYFTDMEHNVTDTVKLDTITNINNYRDHKATVTVAYNNKEVFNKTYDKTLFAKNDKPSRSFLNTAILNGANVNQLDSINKDYTTIDFVFCKPETDDCLLFKLKVNQTGKYVIERIGGL